MQTTTTRKSALPTIKVICVRCMSAHVEVRIDADREPVCEEPCEPAPVRIHEEALAQFPTTA